MNRPPELPEETRREIEAALAAGRKVEAIRLYRDATGASLAEAKTAVEARQRALPAIPGSPPPIRPSGGCALVLATAFAIVAGLLLTA